MLLCLLGCHRHRAELIDPDAPVRVAIATPAGDATVTVEVADVPYTVKQGLMHRTELAPDAGMLFFMDREKTWSFWMRDTRIPLDIVFITKQLTVAGVVHDTVPMTDDRHRVDAPSLYVLEVNAGWAASHHVAAGARVRFENIKL